MYLEIGENYRITSDDKQFILSRKKITQAGRFTKECNVGKITWGDEKYFSELKWALKSIGNDILLQNDDIVEIKQKLDELQEIINGFTVLLEISGEKEEESED